jgi:hypothetical protein
VRLPPEVTTAAFDAALLRGAILKFLATEEELDDPREISRWKYFLVLSLDVTTPEILGAFFTSRVNERRAVLAGDHLVQLEETDYAFLTCRTGITLFDAKALSRTALQERYSRGQLLFLGALRADHMRLVDSILRHSLVLERRKRRLVVA